MKTSKVEALLQLFDETGALFRRLRKTVGEVHGRGVVATGPRGILRSLDSPGPQTVPQLARARQISRQHVQALVNRLVQTGLVATESNPAHRKSPLLRLTPKGKQHLDRLHARETGWLAKAHLDRTAEQIDAAADTLRAIRRFLESRK